jgi:integrase
MASISNDPGGLRRILFVAADGSRKTIRLGKVPRRVATEVKGRVEALLAATNAGVAIDGETARWLANIADPLHAKLAAAGLVTGRARSEQLQLGTFLDAYAAARADVSTGTRTNYGIIGRRLLAFFPADRPLSAIAVGDADRWLVWLRQEYAGPTVSKSVKVARQFWAQAIRDGLATENPFAHLHTPSEVNTARAFFVERAVFEQVLATCPDPEWQLLLALARYGGLRTPSEPLALEWADVNWERQRFRVVAPKTEHEDGGERWVPLFPELLPYLEEAFDRAAPGAVHVITRWRDTAKNLRTGLLRILRRAGVKPWPRLYQNLRSSRETELCERFPIHVVAEWLGNSPKTALAHYTQTTEEHYRQAAQIPAQQAAATARTELQAPRKGAGKMPDLQRVAARCETVQDGLMTPTGFEPVSQP